MKHFLSPYFFLVLVIVVLVSGLSWGGTVSASTDSVTVDVTVVSDSGDDGDSGDDTDDGGGGGGGGTISSTTTGATFSGRAYPGRMVTLLKDAQVAATTVADANANFSIRLTGLSAGNYIFSLYSEDNRGVRSSLLTFPVSVTTGSVVDVGGIFIAPTITTDKQEVRHGDTIAIFGQSAPHSTVTISVSSEEELFETVDADAGGGYLYNLDTAAFAIGEHFTRSKAALNGAISSFGKTISFTVGEQNVTRSTGAEVIGDLNDDARVNLVDFSIAAFWYKRANPPEHVDVNNDGVVNLVDFSIMAFHWTG